MKTRNHLNVAPPPREHEMEVGAESVTLQIPAGAVTLTGDLEIPENAHGLVLFAHGSGSKSGASGGQLVSQTSEAPKMRTQFRDRTEAGELLAEQLAAYANKPDVIVLALRGGVPVGAQVAKKLNVPLDVFVVRKLGVPGHPELAMGAIATGGVRVFNGDVVNLLRIPDEVINAVTAEEFRELQRRERSYRDDLPPPEVEGKTVIIVDDGIATGSTMFAAIAALRQSNASRIIVATPTIALTTYDYLRKHADEVVAVIVPEEFHGVGQWYEDFSQTTDEEVHQLLGETNHRAAPVVA